jgi:hypothetical protein
MTAWDQAKFAKLKASISDEPDVRARLANWDADLIANKKALADAKAALSASTKARDSKYQSLRPLLATETATAIKSHLGELFVLDDEILSTNRLIREISGRGMSQHDRDNLVRRLDAIAIVKSEMINLSPLRSPIRDMQSEIRQLSENGNAAKRIVAQIESAKKSQFDNKQEWIDHYTLLLERHNRKLAQMHADLDALLQRVFG